VRREIYHLYIVCWAKFFYNKPFLLHVHTWISPNRNRSAIHTASLFRVLPGRPSRLQTRDVLKHLPSNPHNLAPSFLLPPLSLHVPCASHSPHAKNRCDNIIGASGRTWLRLTEKRCWGSIQSDTTRIAAVVTRRHNARRVNAAMHRRKACLSVCLSVRTFHLRNC
jgi:hypothetical protein